MSDRRSDQAGDGACVCYCVCLADVSKDCDAHRGIESEVTATSQRTRVCDCLLSLFHTRDGRPVVAATCLPPGRHLV